ncbi:MAG: hypothetical protein JSU59_02795 [Nitrospirota bacterium]|nr:MAG: hypothetical protein JSU59_02795 [Nitrospirota bacterium]
MSTNLWKAVGNVPVSNLSDARLQLHWAAQIVASFGNTLIESRPDDSQSNLGWEDGLNALCSHPTPAGIRAGLRLADLTLLLLDAKQNVMSKFALTGNTLQQGFDWLASSYSTRGSSQPKHPFALREYEMPAHPVQQNAPFSLGAPASFQEYQHWYANAHHVLHGLSDNWKQASPIRCWPHHFDIATLVILDSNKSAEEARSVGCGMSPGDSTYAEPYWYVNLWPYPNSSQLPTMAVGHWHTEGWIGAILTATELIGSGSAETQAQKVSQFFNDATQICFSLLGAHPS